MASIPLYFDKSNKLVLISAQNKLFCTNLPDQNLSLNSAMLLPEMETFNIIFSGILRHANFDLQHRITFTPHKGGSFNMYVGPNSDIFLRDRVSSEAGSVRVGSKTLTWGAKDFWILESYDQVNTKYLSNGDVLVHGGTDITSPLRKNLVSLCTCHKEHFYVAVLCNEAIVSIDVSVEDDPLIFTREDTNDPHLCWIILNLGCYDKIVSVTLNAHYRTSFIPGLAMKSFVVGSTE